MTTAQDVFVGFKKESTYAAAVTVDSFPEFISEDFDQNPKFTPGKGLRSGRVGQAADRRPTTQIEPGGMLELEMFIKGMGKFFEAALGSGASNNVSGSVYQQLFTPATTDPMPSYTFQVGLPVGVGAAVAQTYSGMVCGGFDLTAAQGEIAALKFSFVGKDVVTDVAAATPSYTANNDVLTFVHGAIRVGGSVTVPTTTALASGGTEATNVRDISLNWSNGLDNDGFFLGGAGKRGRAPRLGTRAGGGEMTVEYSSNTLRDAFLAQTSLALVLTFTYHTAIESTYYPTIEFTIPVIRLDGELPKSNGGETIVQRVPFTILDKRTEAMMYVAIRTAETAI